MRIGIDARALQGEQRFRGIGTFTAAVLRSLSKLDDTNCYEIFLSKNLTSDIDPAPQFHCTFVHTRSPHPVVARIKNAMRRDITIKPADKVTVFLQPDPAFGRARGATKNVLVVHDLIGLVFYRAYYPKLTKLIKAGPKAIIGNWLRRMLFHWSLGEIRRADQIIAISESTKHDLIHHLGLAPHKIDVVHEAFDADVYHRGAAMQTPSPIALTPFILYAGGADFRKNISALITAFEALKEQGYPGKLVLVGNDFSDQKIKEQSDLRLHIAHSRWKSHIVCPGFVDNVTLAALYARADVFVFPSLYEGFGIPILEAMACGCPVVALKNSAIPEVAGDAALLVESPDALQTAINQVLDDKALRSRLVIAGIKQAKNFGWKKSAKAILAVLKRVAHEDSG